MHYYIDGYNLMFHFSEIDKDFSEHRQHLINELRQKAKLLHLNCTIVFDACYRKGEGERLHYDPLEIIYTSYGEIADDAILHAIHTHPSPKQTTVVTSDKKLAWFARRCSAQTESITQFVLSLRKRCDNRKSRGKKKYISPKKDFSLLQSENKRWLYLFEKKLNEEDSQK